MNDPLSTPAFAPWRATRPVKPTPAALGGFTLVELMTVISVIMILLSFAVPSLSGILKGKKQDQAVSALESILEGARMEAVTQNTYVWVAFKNCPTNSSPPPPSGEDEVWFLAFRGRTGEDRLMSALGSSMIPVGNFQRLTGVSLLDFNSLTDPLKERLLEVSNQTAPKGDVQLFDPCQMRVSWAGNMDTGPVQLDRVLRFSPRGEAMWEHGQEGIPLQSQPYFTFGVGRTMRGALLLRETDMAAVLLSGFTGRVSVVRP
jgi:Tfp pilus assembly protein FimT